jgi:hypothetical protein
MTRPASQRKVRLLPCPFCGSTDLHLGLSFVECNECRAYGPNCELYETPEHAWNRRASAPAKEKAAKP